jgi:hypothetical protein
MTPKKPSLLDFAKQFERPGCSVCALPERDEVDGGYRSGVHRKNILKWLWEVRGYGDRSTFDESGVPTGLSASMLDKHFSGGHHFKKGES